MPTLSDMQAHLSEIPSLFGNQSRVIEKPILFSFDPPKYDDTRLALIIETQASQNLLPLLLHHIAILPPTWRLLFFGSHESFALLIASPTIRGYIEYGKLKLEIIPKELKADTVEDISQFLTTPWVYQNLIPDVEWLLIIGRGSIICSSTEKSVEDFIDKKYAWIGEPGDNGHGALSLRHMPSIDKVLRSNIRPRNGPAEDVWFLSKIAITEGLSVADEDTSSSFSGGSILGPLNEAGFYEPLGYSTGRVPQPFLNSLLLGKYSKELRPAVWGKKDLRNHIYEYCPEVKLLLQMDVEEYVPGDCRNEWTVDRYGSRKRDEIGADIEGMGTIDEDSGDMTP
jgi:hypothetical protein